MHKKKIYCILDIGGTKIISLLINEYQEIIYRDKYPTAGEAGRINLLAQINRAVEKTTALINETHVLEGIGICVAAYVDSQTGELMGASNLPVTENLPLRKTLADQWKVRVLIENDANAAVAGEVHYGAARGAENAVYVTISTGIGCGLYLEGRLIRGFKGFAGELGHIKTFAGNRLCGCGKQGCLETVASGTAVAGIARDLTGDEQADGNPGQLDSASVFARARAGHDQALRIVNQAGESVGLAFANIITLLNPEYVVVGGGMSKEGDYFLQKIEKYIRHYTSTPAGNCYKMVRAGLDADSGIWGMFYLLKNS